MIIYVWHIDNVYNLEKFCNFILLLYSIIRVINYYIFNYYVFYIII